VRRIAALTAAAATALTVALTAPAGALAAPVSPASDKADFSVSTPAEPLEPTANGTVATELTVANNGTRQLDVKLRAVGVLPLDDGKVSLDEQSDPAWAKEAAYPGSLSLAPHSLRRVPVSLRMPAGLLPDVYLLGFVVEAQPHDGGADIRVYHRVGALITVQVPGPRERRLDLELEPTGFLHIGSTLDGSFKVRNVGSAAALGRGQVQVNEARSRENVAVVQATDKMELFPAGTSRQVAFEYVTHGWFLYARPQAQLLYGNGTSAMQSVIREGEPVLIIPWRTIIVACLILLALTAYLIWRRRQRAAQRRAVREAGAVPFGKQRSRDTVGSSNACVDAGLGGRLHGARGRHRSAHRHLGRTGGSR